MPESSTGILAPSAMGQTRLSEFSNGSGRADVQQPPITPYCCLVDHLPPEMSEAHFRDLIGVVSHVPITWFPGPEYVWCLVTLSEADAIAMEQRLDGLELDDQHTLRCEAIGSRRSAYASAESYHRLLADAR
jgi:hypothetical protein